jgi:hypothetical protein
MAYQQVLNVLVIYLYLSDSNKILILVWVVKQKV